jgi:hypothetical protein
VTGVVRFQEGRFKFVFPDPEGLGGLGRADIRCYRGVTRLVVWVRMMSVCRYSKKSTSDK